MSDWHGSAAAAFDAVAVPLVGTRREVARVLGIADSTYGEAVRGKREGTKAATGWCRRWYEARSEKIVLVHWSNGLWTSRLLGDGDVLEVTEPEGP